MPARGEGKDLSAVGQNGSRLSSLGTVRGEREEIWFPILKDPRNPQNA